MFGSSNKNGLANMNKWGKFLKQNCDAALVESITADLVLTKLKM